MTASSGVNLRLKVYTLRRIWLRLYMISLSCLVGWGGKSNFPINSERFRSRQLWGAGEVAV